MDTSNAGVIEVQQESRLTLEPFYLLAALSLVLKFTQHLFNCTRAIETRIDCAIDGTSTTRGYQFLNLVASAGEFRTGRKVMMVSLIHFVRSSLMLFC